MATIVVCASGVANFPNGGGHFWVFMQYVQSLRCLGCDVYWLERFHVTRDRQTDAAMQKMFFDRMEAFGLGGRAILYTTRRDGTGACEYVGASKGGAVALFHRADLLLNFEYRIDGRILAEFKRTALVDIDPGLLQFWIATGQIVIAPHDVYITIGEHVPSVSDMAVPGRPWHFAARPVCLDFWPADPESECSAFTTVSSWWGGYGFGEWVSDGKGMIFENNKRVSFLQFVELPRSVGCPLELALCMGDGRPVDRPVLDTDWCDETASDLAVTDYIDDATDRRRLERHGWRVRCARQAAGTPEAYQLYIMQSRGEFSCAKPSCMRFQNAWISDRTLCYLASGKPAIVQHTGPSAILPDGEGLLRFQTFDEAVDALWRVDEAYPRHSRAARDIVTTHFDGTKILADILNTAISARTSARTSSDHSSELSGLWEAALPANCGDTRNEISALFSPQREARRIQRPSSCAPET
jgi:hypothetical protein